MRSAAGLEEAAELLADVPGQFACHWEPRPGLHLLARDRLGVNKLFFAVGPDGALDAANYWLDLLRRGHPPEAVWSVPAGHVLEIEPARRSLRRRRHTALPFGEGAWDPAALPEHAARIRERLEALFRDLRALADGRRVYVALSGGLDSGGIAVLAREFLGEFTAVTFALAPAGAAPRSDDLAAATRLAGELGVPLLRVLTRPEEVLATLDEALAEGQDWREFNVHCALVNAAVGKAVQAHSAGEGGDRPPLLLTGDVMNELVADYTPVVYGGVEYYSLPRLAPGRLRRFLVTGLDAGDREIGVFHRRGVAALQPYAFCAEAYTALPAGMLLDPNAKQRLARAVFGERLPRFVAERPKTRAQCGSEGAEGGTLALLADRGLDARWLAARFAALYRLPVETLSRFIVAGMYRFPTRYPG